MILFSNMRIIVMFVTAVCVLFLIKLRWPKKNNFYHYDYIILIVIIITITITIIIKSAIILQWLALHTYGSSLYYYYYYYYYFIITKNWYYYYYFAKIKRLRG